MTPRRLVLLVTPSDRWGDARRLDEAGVRVIATSRAESSLRQVVNAQPAVIAIEWLPSFADETIGYVAQLMRSTRTRAIQVLVYGHAPVSVIDEVLRAGAEWVDVTAADRDPLVRRARDCLAGSRPVVAPSR